MDKWNNTLSTSVVYGWTGLNQYWVTTSTCNNWSSSSGAYYGGYGMGYQNKSGVADGTIACDSSDFKLYCVEQ